MLHGSKLIQFAQRYAILGQRYAALRWTIVKRYVA
jgi:hypothetical protein